MFCRIRVSFESSKVSVLENRGLFFYGKVNGKGQVCILENDHSSSFSNQDCNAKQRQRIMEYGLKAENSEHQ